MFIKAILVAAEVSVNVAGSKDSVAPSIAFPINIIVSHKNCKSFIYYFVPVSRVFLRDYKLIVVL